MSLMDGPDIPVKATLEEFDVDKNYLCFQKLPFCGDIKCRRVP